MNALERNGEFSHRGQRITLERPPRRELQVGDRVQITFNAPYSWLMSATVVDVDDTRVRLEPGAAVKHPARWFIAASPGATAREPEAMRQFDLFAGV